MYITKEDFDKLNYCVDILYRKKGKRIELYPDQEEAVCEAVVTLVRLMKKRKKDFARSTDYMNDKRKTDKRYYRTKKQMAAVLAESESYPIDDAEEIKRKHSLSELTAIYKGFLAREEE